MVFNPLNWERSEVVTVPDAIYTKLENIKPGNIKPGSTKSSHEWQVYDVSGKRVISQWVEDSSLLFLANDIPSVGYKVFWLTPVIETVAKNLQKNTSEDAFNLREQQRKADLPRFTLENEFLRAIVDEKNGNLASIFDKINRREILAPEGGNQLQAFQDSGQYWDAWNIDPNYAEHQLPSMELKSIDWVERGAIQNRLRVVRQLGKSEFRQDYILQAACPMLKIATKVNWLERQVMVKAAFPVNLEAAEATYEIPCAAIRRPTNPTTPQGKAKWEVPGLRWADLTAKIKEEENNSVSQIQNSSVQKQNYYGVSLLNDCKYGYDVQPSQLRLTLLRSPNWPNPDADKGLHEFTYAVYPHQGNWQKAQTVKRGYELNIPLQVVQLNTELDTKLINNNISLPSCGSFLNLSADNLILMAFKQAEDNTQQWILRCYECHGETANLSLQNSLGLKLTEAVDLLEHPINNSQPKHSQPKHSQTKYSQTKYSQTKYSQLLSAQPNLTIQPWKIATFKVSVHKQK